MNKKKLFLTLISYIMVHNSIASDSLEDQNKKIPIPKIVASMFVGGLMGLQSGYFLTESYKKSTTTLDKLIFPFLTIGPFVLEPLLRWGFMDLIADKPLVIISKGRNPTTYERAQLGNIGWISSWVGFITALINSYAKK